MHRIRFPWDQPLEKQVKIDSIILTLPKDYDIVCALRGPDSYDADALKWVTTARIRFLIGMRHGYGGAVNMSADAPSISLASEQLRNWGDGGYHWASHINHCLTAMQGDKRFDQKIVSQIQADMMAIRGAVAV